MSARHISPLGCTDYLDQRCDHTLAVTGVNDAIANAAYDGRLERLSASQRASLKRARGRELCLEHEVFCARKPIGSRKPQR